MYASFDDGFLPFDDTSTKPKNTLVLLGKGLGSEMLRDALLKIHSIPECLMLVIGSEEAEETEDVSFQVGPPKRRELYLRGGVIHLTSRLLINDLLNEVLPAHLITTLLISRMEQCPRGGIEAFAARVIRDRNPISFIIGLSDSPLRLAADAERRMREFGFERLLLYPRFHDSVMQSLSFKGHLCYHCGSGSGENAQNNRKNNVVDLEEILLPMPKALRKLQVTLLDLLDGLYKELPKLVPSFRASAELTLESLLVGDLIEDLRFDGCGSLLPKAKEIRDELLELRMCLCMLSNRPFESIRARLRDLAVSGSGGRNEEAWFTLLPSYPLLHDLIHTDSLEVKDLKIEFLKQEIFCDGGDGGDSSGDDIKRNNNTNNDSNTSKSTKNDYIVLCERPKTKEIIEEEGLLCCLFSDFIDFNSGKILYLYENNLSFIRKIELMCSGACGGCICGNSGGKSGGDSGIDEEKTTGKTTEKTTGKTTTTMLKVLSYKDSMEEEKNLLEIREEKRAFEGLILRSPNFSLKQPALISLSETQRSKGKIVVDMRELRSPFPFALYKNGFSLDTQTLKVADYLLTPRCGVERKSLSDFVQSNRSGRLYWQMTRMNRLYEIPILLLEFSEDLVFGLENQLSFVSGGGVGGGGAVSGEFNNFIRGIVMLCICFERMRIIWSPSFIMTNHVFEDLKVGEAEPLVGGDGGSDGGDGGDVLDEITTATTSTTTTTESDIANDVLIKLVGSTFAAALIRAGAESLLDVVGWDLERIEEAIGGGGGRVDALRIYRTFNDKINLL